MKALLVLAAAACLVSFLRSPGYRITLVYLAAVIPATLAFRAESAWLHSWYILLAGPVAGLRFACALEVCHRQTEGFRYWARLMGSVFLLAGLLAGLGWVHVGRPGLLASAVELRRLLQLYTGAVFLVLELFWVSQGGGLWRRADQIALGFALLAWNHAAVSCASGVLRLSPGAWESVSSWSWGIDAAVYLGLTGLCLNGRKFYSAIAGLLPAGLAGRESRG